jgi:hypothetical protein
VTVENAVPLGAGRLISWISEIGLFRPALTDQVSKYRLLVIQHLLQRRSGVVITEVIMIHTDEIHALEMHPHDVHAYEVHTNEMHTQKVRARDIWYAP